MQLYRGQVKEIRRGWNGERLAWIGCAHQAIPDAGRYTLAWSIDNENESLAVALFPAQIERGAFLSAMPVPKAWLPGSELILRGPLGRGFFLPEESRRLVIAPLDGALMYLNPLILQGLKKGSDVVVCMDGNPSRLPTAVEVQPIEMLPELLNWADFLAMEMHLALMERFRTILGLGTRLQRITCPSQILLLASMPCGGLADCGVCSLGPAHGRKLICKDGPVFDIMEFLKVFG